MPYIITVLLFAVGAAVLFFSKTVRDTIINLLTGAGFLALGAWKRRPTSTQAWRIIKLPLIILLVVWAVCITIVLCIGFYINAPMAAFLVALLLPPWCVLRILRRLPMAGRLFKFLLPITWWGISAILVIASIYVLVGVWSPEYKASASRYYSNKKIEWANGLDKKSIQSEPESGIFAKTKETAYVYNIQNVVIQTLRQGETVLCTNLAGKKEEDREGMTRVRVSDENGDFVKGGKIGWVASRLLDFNWKKPEEKKPEPTVAPPQNVSFITSSVGGKMLSIELRPDEVYSVDDLAAGQNFRYLSFNGAFSHRINKGDDQACWKLVDNNLPWSANCAGKLQIKAGNTPVKLTVNVL